MSELSEQERYCISLMILNGGNIGYYHVRDIITEFPECFSGLNETYLKNKKIRNILNILVETSIDRYHDIFSKNLSTGNMINQLKQEKMREKVDFDRETWMTFLDGAGLVYKFRNIVGAHASWEYREDQLAMSCLVLSFYLVGNFMEELNPPDYF